MYHLTHIVCCCFCVWWGLGSQRQHVYVYSHSHRIGAFNGYTVCAVYLFIFSLKKICYQLVTSVKTAVITTAAVQRLKNKRPEKIHRNTHTFQYIRKKKWSCSIAKNTRLLLAFSQLLFCTNSVRVSFLLGSVCALLPSTFSCDCCCWCCYCCLFLMYIHRPLFSRWFSHWIRSSFFSIKFLIFTHSVGMFALFEFRLNANGIMWDY